MMAGLPSPTAVSLCKLIFVSTLDLLGLKAKRCECVVIGAFRDGCESGGAFEGIWFDLATPTDDLNWCDVESVELLGVVVDDDEENP